MSLHCRPGILFLYLALGFMLGCAAKKKLAAPHSEVQAVLAQGKDQFQECGRFLPSSGERQTVQLTFRINPEGLLETLALDQATEKNQSFFDCVYNVLDRMKFSSTEEHTALEIQQKLVFRPRK